MQRLLFVVMLACSSCCISGDTKNLARIIASSTATQNAELTELADMRLDTGKKVSETQRGKILLKRALKLQEATSGLADLIGAPKEVE